MSNKKKIASNPSELTFHRLQILAKELKIQEWQTKSRDELIESIGEIAIYDKNKERISQILDLAPRGFKPFGEIWLELFEKNKLWTSLISVIVGIGAAFLINYLDTNRSTQIKKNDLEDLAITQQIDNLNEVEYSLNSLIAFVQHQKKTLNQTEQKIQKLTDEKSELEPIVNANRDVVEAIFKQQSEYNKKDVWQERAIGFVLGIIGSIIASILFNLFGRKRSKGQNNSNLNENEHAS